MLGWGMRGIVGLRKDIETLAESLAAAPNVRSAELRERVKTVLDALKETYWDKVHEDPDWFAPHFHEATQRLHRQWRNTPWGDPKIRALQCEFEAAAALSVAWGIVGEKFRVRDDDSLLNTLFSRDIFQEQQSDAGRYQHLTNEAQEMERWPIYLMMSAMAFSIGIGDTVAGSGGMAAGIFGMGGIAGAGYAYFMRKRSKEIYRETYALETKWGGKPTMELPDLK